MATEFHRASEAPAEDYTIPQDWEGYTEEEHATWSTLYQRLMKVLPGRADDAFLEGLDALDLNRGGIPHFERMSDELEKITGWRTVASRRAISSASPINSIIFRSRMSSTMSSAMSQC